MKRRITILAAGVVILLILAGLVGPRLYRTRVERAFSKFTRLQFGDKPFVVKQSLCLGSPANRIKLLPIIRSRLTGSYPYAKDEGPLGRAQFQSAYHHGYYFNYCKVIRAEPAYGTPDQDLIAFWSLKEGRWHMGNFADVGGRVGWRDFEACGEPPMPNK
jgi:hypothetical protein